MVSQANARRDVREYRKKIPYQHAVVNEKGFLSGATCGCNKENIACVRAALRRAGTVIVIKHPAPFRIVS
jgi:hypothetical protein